MKGVVSTDKPILTMDDLCARWGGVSPDVVLNHIADDGLPMLPLGRKANGKRPIRLFRREAIEAWERERERVARKAEGADTLPPAPGTGGMSPGWDGVDRLKRTKRGAKSGATGRP